MGCRQSFGGEPAYTRRCERHGHYAADCRHGQAETGLTVEAESEGRPPLRVHHAPPGSVLALPAAIPYSVPSRGPPGEARDWKSRRLGPSRCRSRLLDSFHRKPTADSHPRTVNRRSAAIVS
jgi:hypothetical protein